MIQYIPAIDIVESQKKDNATSLYEHYIQLCEAHGLDVDTVRNFMEYQILTDFILTNTDRHLNNFGLLRNASTLKYVGVAPIFDSGNSMFRTNPQLAKQDDLTRIEVNSFRKTEDKLLRLVTNRSLIDLSLLPTEEELRTIYSMDELISYTDLIISGYKKKIEILENII